MHNGLGNQRDLGPLHDDVDAAAPQDNPDDHYGDAADDDSDPADNHDQQTPYDHHDRQ
jgi:hypothetical protein